MSGTHRMISNESTLRPMRTMTIACTFAAIAACGLSACKNPDRTDRYLGSNTSVMQAPTPAPAPAPRAQPQAKASTKSKATGTTTTEKILAMADQSRLVSSDSSNRLGLRTIWQSTTAGSGTYGIDSVHRIGNDLVVADRNNVLTDLRLDSGEQIWKDGSLPRNETIFGIDLFETNGRDFYYVTTDTDIFVIAADTGYIVNRQNMVRIPDTSVIRAGENLIFGTASGRIVWHNTRVGYELKANKLSSGIVNGPIRVGKNILAASIDGEIMLMSANSGQRFWRKDLKVGVRSAPTASKDAAYVADQGQRLTCMELESGQKLWQFFNPSPFVGGPIIIGDRVLQFSESEGLSCFEALPLNSPQGRRLWSNADIQGEILTALGNDILVWNAQRHMLARIDSDRGDLKSSVTLPMVSMITASRDAQGDLLLIAASNDGRLQLLESKN
jgi:outer membrane protein assembly factor BamB